MGATGLRFVPRVAEGISGGWGPAAMKRRMELAQALGAKSGDGAAVEGEASSKPSPSHCRARTHGPCYGGEGLLPSQHLASLILEASAWVSQACLP